MNRLRAVTNQESLDETLTYIARQSRDLGKTVLGKIMPVDTLALFAQSEEEFEAIRELLGQCGSQSELSHGKTVYYETDLRISGNRIKLIGARMPDETRPQVGYGDFPVDDFGFVKAKHATNPFVTAVRSGLGIDMLELRHHDFDVLGYVVPTIDHQ